MCYSLFLVSSEDRYTHRLRHHRMLNRVKVYSQAYYDVKWNFR